MRTLRRHAALFATEIMRILGITDSGVPRKIDVSIGRLSFSECARAEHSTGYGQDCPAPHLLCLLIRDFGRRWRNQLPRPTNISTQRKTDQVK